MNRRNLLVALLLAIAVPAFVGCQVVAECLIDSIFGSHDCEGDLSPKESRARLEEQNVRNVQEFGRYD